MRLPRLLGTALTFVVLLSPPAAAQTRYVAMGDSITNGEGFDDPDRVCPEECGYAPRLEAILRAAGREATVENAGLGGEDTGEGLTRIEEVVEGKDVLLLMEGTNDVSKNMGVETTLFNLNRMAERALRRGVVTVHATVIPRIPTAKTGDGDNKVTTQLARGIRQLAWERGRALADPFEVFTTTPNYLSDLYYPDPGDPVGHPNAAGFDELAEIFGDVILGIDSVPPVLGAVTPPDGAEVKPTQPVRLVLFDFGRGIDVEQTDLTLDGSVVPATKTGNARRLELVWNQPGGLRGVVDVGYRGVDNAEPANVTERQVARLLVEGTRLLPGDMDRSGRVDGRDLVLFARRFGAVDGDRLYRTEADLRRDGVIDGRDLAILAANFGKSI